MGQGPPLSGEPIEPARPGGWIAAPVVPWGPLLLACAAAVAASSGLMAVHAATRWRSFAALPPDAPMIGAEKTALSDIAPTLVDVAVPTSWVGFAISLVWCEARQRGKLGRRRPIPGEVTCYILGTWALYLLTRQVSSTMARPAVLTNATNAAAWACSAISWTTLCVSWAVAAFVVPRYDRIPFPAR